MALISVYNWEIIVADYFEELSRDSFVIEFANYISYPPKFFWWILAILLLFLILKYGKKMAIPLVGAGAAAGLGDLISYRIIKMTFERPRPRALLTDCVQSNCWGFVSSHSTNIAAVATVLCLYDRRNIYWCVPLWILVAGSRVVLADHFALDVICGGLVGICVGIIVQRFLAMCLAKIKSRRMLL